VRVSAGRVQTLQRPGHAVGPDLAVLHARTGVCRVARAARGPGTFTIGFMPGLIVTDAVRAMQGRHPQLTVNVLRTSWDDQTEVVHDGRADVSYVRLPADQRGLQIQPLLTEPRVAALPDDHHIRYTGRHATQPGSTPQGGRTPRRLPRRRARRCSTARLSCRACARALPLRRPGNDGPRAPVR
jgi:DNA-binding transcriptional LysR family regulator